MLLSECVLIYLSTKAADAVVSWGSAYFDRSIFLCYEQIRPNDAFGQVMLDNMEVRRGGRAATPRLRRGWADRGAWIGRLGAVRSPFAPVAGSRAPRRAG